MSMDSDSKSSGGDALAFQSADLNVCLLSGTLEREPIRSVTSNGNNVIYFTLAVERRGSTSDEPKYNWFSISSFNNIVVDTCSSLKKGSKIIVDGYLTARNILDKTTNEKKLRYEIMAEKVKVLSSDSDYSGKSFGGDSSLPDEIFE